MVEGLRILMSRILPLGWDADFSVFGACLRRGRRRRHAGARVVSFLLSGGDVAGFGVEGGEEAVAFLASGFEVAGFKGGAVALFGISCDGAEGEVEPPDSVVVPEVVVGVVFGAAGGEVVFRGHGSSVF